MKTKNKTLALLEIAIVLCSILLVSTLPAIAADQTDEPLEIYGNANEDDTLDMRDVTYIKLVIFGKKPETKLADANYDGKVSMLDVGQTKLIILGKEKKLTVIDLADRVTTIDKPVERIVVTFNYEELFAVGGRDVIDKIVGWDRYWPKWRPSLWEKYTTAIPKLKDVADVGSPGKTFSVENVITLEPDIVIVSVQNFENAEDNLEKVERAGIPVVCINYYDAETIEETGERFTKSSLLLGEILGKEERAQELVEWYHEERNKVLSHIEEMKSKPKQKVYLEICCNKWHSYGRWRNGLVIEQLGGIHIAGEIIPGTSGEISPEYVLTSNPDVIIETARAQDPVPLGYYATNREELRESLRTFCDRPGWDTLNAIKNQRVWCYHHVLTHGHMFDVISIQVIAKALYPELFKDLDPEETFKEFHERFLPVDYTGIWMISLSE
jgi:iron complex transport system substrate-binding protein